jgi:dihydrofolate reductase
MNFMQYFPFSISPLSQKAKQDSIYRRWYNFLMNTARVSFVVAMSKQTRAIGKNQGLLWRIPRDLQHFKEVTLGHPMIMGRATFDSIGKVLPGRTTIVVTRNTTWNHEGTIACHSLEEALTEARKIEDTEITIIGGGQIFQQALPLVDRIYLTLIDDEQEGDVYFPLFDENLFTETARENGTFEGINYSICTLDRVVQSKKLTPCVPS